MGTSTTSSTSSRKTTTTEIPISPAPSTSVFKVTNMSSPSTATSVFNVTNMTNVTKIAGVLEVEIYVQNNISHEIVQDMFIRAIAAAVEIPIELVTSLIASEIQHTSGAQRRLQDNVTNQTSAMNNHTKMYKVAYE